MANHNSTIKIKFLSPTAVGQLRQVHEIQTVIITGFPLSSDTLCCKLLDRFKFIGIELGHIVWVPYAKTVKTSGLR